MVSYMIFYIPEIPGTPRVNILATFILLVIDNPLCLISFITSGGSQ